MDLEAHFSEQNLLQEFSGSDLCDYIDMAYKIRNMAFVAHADVLEYFGKGDFKQRGQWFQELQAVHSIALVKPNSKFQICKDDEKGPDILIDGFKFQIVETVDGSDRLLRSKKMKHFHSVSVTSPISHHKKADLTQEDSWKTSYKANSNTELDEAAFERFESAYKNKKSKGYPKDISLIIYCNDNYTDVILMCIDDHSLPKIISNFLKDKLDFPGVIVTCAPKKNKPSILHPCTP
jgi:hypothetical protein